MARRQFRATFDVGTALLERMGLFQASLKLQPVVHSTVMAPSPPAADYLVDGVPLPADAKVAALAEPQSAMQRRWTGAWVGAWGGVLKHILLVESVAEDATARVVYSVGDLPAVGIRAAWVRHTAAVSERRLTVTGAGFSATYEPAEGGALATYLRGGVRSQALMVRADFAALTKPGAVVDWTGGKSELLQTDLVEDGKPIRLEAVIFRPSGTGPFPLAVFNHGSTGVGTDPALFTATWFAVDVADFLNSRGWMVAFPQRRGRGKSDGLYDEGFSADRTQGYSLDAETTLAGADRALRDIEAAVTALRRRPDVAPSGLLIGGQSRGGVLAVAYAGAHPDRIAGVINFVGGWLGEGCPAAPRVNQTLFSRGAGFHGPMLWLYAQRDPFYSIPHSRENFAAFEQAGGQGKFLEFDIPGGNGHFLIGATSLWSAAVDDYLNALAAAERRAG
jgi:dienelactone hydrolase